MNIRLKKDRVIVIAFVILSLGSLIYVAYATANYLPFFSALNQLQMKVLKVVLSGGGNPDQTAMYVQFQVSNPGAYSGFEVYSSSASLDFFVTDNSSITLFTAQPLLAGSIIRSTLGANSQFSTNLIVPLSPSNRTSLVQFDNQYGSKVRAHVTMTVDIVTFLNPVVGHTHLIDDNSFPLSAS